VIEGRSHVNRGIPLAVVGSLLLLLTPVAADNWVDIGTVLLTRSGHQGGGYQQGSSYQGNGHQGKGYQDGGHQGSGNHSSGHARIDAQRPGKYRRIEFQISDSATRIYSVVVHFDSGRDLPLSGQAAGGQSHAPAFDLPGDQRQLKSVTFQYANKPNSDVRVTLKGKH
jgi:hypothetical protein